MLCGKGPARSVLIHTTFYMERAIAVYSAFGFRPCAPFRDTPAHVRHTDVSCRARSKAGEGRKPPAASRQPQAEPCLSRAFNSSRRACSTGSV